MLLQMVKMGKTQMSPRINEVHCGVYLILPLKFISPRNKCGVTVSLNFYDCNIRRLKPLELQNY